MGRYLPEWIAYHWALGVDEFMVYDDESIDDTREVRERERDTVGYCQNAPRPLRGERLLKSILEKTGRSTDLDEIFFQRYNFWYLWSVFAPS